MTQSVVCHEIMSSVMQRWHFALNSLDLKMDFST